MQKVRGKIKNYLAECKTALFGVVIAYREYRFVITVIIAFLVFGTLLSLLSGGTSGFSLLAAGEIGSFLNCLGKAFLGLFGVGREFLDWLMIFLISLLQATVIGLIALVWRGRKEKAKISNADNVEKAGIAAGLAVLGSGCPTCGTTLLMPVITAVVGSEGMALAGTVSGVLTVLAVVILLFSMKSLGFEAYTLLIEKKLAKKEKK